MFNTENRFGLVAILLHWSMAIAIVTLFGVGLYMVELTYYDELYQVLPFYHMSVGMLLAAVLVFRLIWKFVNPTPRPVPGSKPWEHRLAKLVHALLYVLLIALVCTGYLINTADGSAISVFDWFEVPALISDIPDQEDLAGDAHELLAYAVIGLAIAHAAAALKHHFINRDDTLRRMLGRSAH